MKKPIALWLKENYTSIRNFLLFLTFLPLIRISIAWNLETLGVNPLQFLQQNTGFWALFFLTATLSITPLRRLLAFVACIQHSRFGKRLSDWNWIIRTRRMLGLAGFFYVCLHVFIYANFDLDYNLDWALQDFQEKPYLLAGAFGFLLLIPLALTSPKFMMKKMGKYWRRLHRLSYPAILLALLHFSMAAKSGNHEVNYFIFIISLLLGYRLLAYFGLFVRKPKDDGMEVPPRPTSQKMAKVTNTR